MKVTVLGCGGSLGVPMVGGLWGDCDPTNPRNRRRRPSILVTTASTTVLVDTSPDLRDQLLDAGVRRLDAVLFTHDHADHLHGVDDLRPLTFWRDGPIPAYCDPATKASLEDRFGYVVDSVVMERGPYRPLLTLRLVDGPLTVGDLTVQPFRQDHGFGPSLGLRFGPFAYSTDVVDLDDAAFEALDGVDTWMVDATRLEPHPSHAHLDRTLEWIARLGPRQAYLTHMNHQMDYDSLVARLPDGVAPAYDGLVLEF